MNFSVFHDIFACFQLYIGESLTNINSRETTRQENACVWYPKHARLSRKELGVMKQPCGARRTPPDGIPEPLKPDFQDFGRGVTRTHQLWTIKKNRSYLLEIMDTSPRASFFTIPKRFGFGGLAI